MYIMNCIKTLIKLIFYRCVVFIYENYQGTNYTLNMIYV